LCFFKRIIAGNLAERKPGDSDRQLYAGPHSEVETGSLKERSIRSGAITFIDQGLSFAVSFISVIILARLLTPEDFGIVAMVTAITGFVNLFRELGLSSATIQSRDITHDQVSALFWANAALGMLITLVIAASGPVIAWFYQKPQLAYVAAGISLTSVLGSLGTQHGALLNRQMRFVALAVVRISSLLAGLLAAVAVALSGGTYWALVANSVVTALWSTCGVWFASGFRPGRPRRGTGVRPLLRFGASIAGFDIVNYFDRNMDNILIGRVWGAQQLGFYSKAYSLLMLPISNMRSPLHRVAFPVLSRLQNDPETFRKYFVRYCSLLAFISMPLVAFLFSSSEKVILLVLGPRWLGAVELFSILALVSFIQPISGLPGTILVALGRGARYFWWGLYTSLIAVISFFCGLPWGAKGVAIGYCVATYVSFHPFLVYALHNTPIRPSDFYRALWKPCFASIIMCISSMFVVRRLHGVPDALVLALALLSASLVYLAVSRLLPGGKQAFLEYREYFSIILEMRRRHK
jgi:O-antigen/teichoic acid export membrane protein